MTCTLPVDGRAKPRREALAERYRKSTDPFKIVIVRDMWLTGFDAPSMHTMYVDKPMRGHGLMQAIARVNRVFKDKPGGLVVDYLGLAEELKRNAEFRLMFADRVQEHFFGEGALTPAACSARWMKRAAEVDQAVIAESARWGYYRNNPAYTRDRDWIAEQKRLTGNYFPRRTGIVLKQLQSAGLYPRIFAPTLRGETLIAPDGGKIYFSTNGLDPREPMTGAVGPHAIKYMPNQSISPEGPLKARILNGTTWSALLER